MPPVAAPSCNSLSPALRIASLWESGYMAHVVIGSWQAGGELKWHQRLEPSAF